MAFPGLEEETSQWVVAEFAREVERVAIIGAEIALKRDGLVEGIVSGGGDAAGQIGNARIERRKLQIDFANLFGVVAARRARLSGPCNRKPRDAFVTDLSEVAVRVRDRAGRVGNEPTALDRRVISACISGEVAAQEKGLSGGENGITGARFHQSGEVQFRGRGRLQIASAGNRNPTVGRG